VAETSKKQMSVYALIAALATGGGGFVGAQQALEIADTHWMTHDQHSALDLKEHIRNLKREIRELEYDIEKGTASEKDKWNLDNLKQDLLEAEDEQT
jgi:uncharacterized protein HemX